MPHLPARAGLNRMDYKSKSVLQALGLNPKNAGTHDFKALTSGKKENLGQLLEHATLGMSALQESAMNAPMVESVPANGVLRRADPTTGNMQDHGALEFEDGQQFMVVDNHVVGMFSGGFQPYQHGQALDDIHNALAELGVTRTAQNVRFDNHGARMSAHIFMPGFFGDFNLLQDTGEDILLGIAPFNSHDGSRGLGFRIVGIRTICTNYSLRGVAKWGISLGHSSGMVKRWKDALVKAKQDFANVPEVINAAKACPVAIKDVAPLLVGLDMPVPYIMGGKKGHVKTLPALGANPWAYNPDIPVGATETDLWQVYNAGTALLTHAYAGAPAQAEAFSAKLGRVLEVKSLDGLISAGRATLDSLAKAATDNAKA